MADDEQRLLDAEFLAACTVSFNGFGYKGMPKGPEMYKAAYLDPKMGLVSEQVNKGIGIGQIFAQIGEELELFAAQCGWLDATPKPPPSAWPTNTPGPTPAAAAAACWTTATPALPDVGHAHYLVAHWLSTGCCQASLGGPIPLSAAELQAWQAGSGHHLLPWEWALLRQMSVAYCAARQAGTEAATLPRMTRARNAPDAPAIDRQAVEQNFRALFRNRTTTAHPAPKRSP